MRLLNIPKMYKEELLYSYLLRLAEANGFTNPKTFFNHRGIFPDKDDTRLRLDSLEDIGFLLPQLSSYYTCDIIPVQKLLLTIQCCQHICHL